MPPCYSALQIAVPHDAPRRGSGLIILNEMSMSRRVHRPRIIIGAATSDVPGSSANLEGKGTFYFSLSFRGRGGKGDKEGKGTFYFSLSFQGRPPGRWRERGQVEGEGTFYFSLSFRGRPRGRRLASRPKRTAVSCLQNSVPKAYPGRRSASDVPVPMPTGARGRVPTNPEREASDPGRGTNPTRDRGRIEDSTTPNPRRARPIRRATGSARCRAPRSTGARPPGSGRP